MTNAYADLTTLKSAGVLNISGAAYDSRLLDLLEAVSRLIDHYCNRRFHVVEESRFFDGDGGKELGVPDLISVTSLKTDDNRDRTFETSWAATDYLLYPPNARPGKPWGPPLHQGPGGPGRGQQDSLPRGTPNGGGERQVGVQGGDGRHRRRYKPRSGAVGGRNRRYGHRRRESISRPDSFDRQ